MLRVILSSSWPVIVASANAVPGQFSESELTIREHRCGPRVCSTLMSAKRGTDGSYAFISALNARAPYFGNSTSVPIMSLSLLAPWRTLISVPLRARCGRNPGTRGSRSITTSVDFRSNLRRRQHKTPLLWRSPGRSATIIWEYQRRPARNQTLGTVLLGSATLDDPAQRGSFDQRPRSIGIDFPYHF